MREKVDMPGNLLTMPGSTAALEDFRHRCVTRVDTEIERLLPSEDCQPGRLHGAMRYAVMAGGKRLRPVLAVAAHEAAGGSDERIYLLGAALEMLHTYSLIHDDLPCMDDDEQRRGQPTVHVAYDEATAVLAGDALHALAFEILAGTVPAAIVSRIAHAIGTTGMLGGQMADLEAEGTTPTESRVREIHQRKTGALIVASAWSGAMLADAPPEVPEMIENYARPLGLAFQIVDDLLEAEGDAGRLGKSTTSDRDHGKVTFPGAVGSEAAWRKARTLVQEAKQALVDWDGDRSILVAVADFVVARDH